MIVFQIQSLLWGNFNDSYMAKLRWNIFIHGWKRRKIFPTKSAFRSRKLLGLSRKTLLSLMTCIYHYQFGILCFMWAGLEAGAARSWFADPTAQILGDLRQKQETIARGVLLCSQEVTFGKSWNSLTQFLGPQQGFCQIRAMWDLLPWWSCSGAPRSHPCDLPAYLENASCKTLSVFCWMIWTNAVPQSIAFRINGSGWFLFFVVFPLNLKSVSLENCN